MIVKNLLREAYRLAAEKSTDHSTKVGAIISDWEGSIVISGVNAFTNAQQTQKKENHERPRKYKVTEHAERAAIYKAARAGFSTEGHVLICPWASCPDCARAVVLAGITLVVGHKQALERTPERWKEDIAIGMEIMKGSDVSYILYDGEIGGIENLFDGEIWLP